MDMIGSIAAVISLVIVMGLFWVVRRLQREIRTLKRDWYYHQQAVKGISHDISAAVDPLRVHVASLAEGKPVSPELIRSGRLYQDITGPEAARLAGEAAGRSDTCWLDVRSSTDFAKRRIPGALLIPVEQLDARYRTELSPSLPSIIVYCDEGDRSRLACDFLSRQGFTNIIHLRGGLAGWPGPLEGDRSGPLLQITSKKRSSEKEVAS
jgi:rhodanese-related sulfurtransferase